MASSGLVMGFLCSLAIFACWAALDDASNRTSGDLEGEKYEFGDPKTYNHVLRLPSEKDHSIYIEERPNEVYPKWEPRFPVQGRPFMMPFRRESGRSRYLDERNSIVRRFSFGSRWPFRFGRPGGCDHSKRKHFSMRGGDYGRGYFPGGKGPDSITLHLEVGALRIFPTQPDSAGFSAEDKFGPADLEESKPYDSPVSDADVPEEHVHWVFFGEAAPRSHEEQEEGPAGRWMGWLKSLFRRP